MAMKPQEIQARIDKLKDKIMKKQGTIEKYKKKIEKLSNKFNKVYGRYPDLDNIDQEDDLARDLMNNQNDDTAYDIISDIWDTQDAIKNCQAEIQKTEGTIGKYEAQMSKAVGVQTVTNTYPDILKQLKDELVDEWDAWDLDYQKKLKAEYQEKGHDFFVDKHGYSAIDWMHKRPEGIHKENVNSADKQVLNLFNKVRHITGDNIYGWDKVKMSPGPQGGVVLNGVVQGQDGTARVESFGAGGWNIQRYHIRCRVTDISPKESVFWKRVIPKRRLYS